MNKIRLLILHFTDIPVAYFLLLQLQIGPVCCIFSIAAAANRACMLHIFFSCSCRYRAYCIYNSKTINQLTFYNTYFLFIIIKMITRIINFVCFKFIKTNILIKQRDVEYLHYGS